MRQTSTPPESPPAIAHRSPQHHQAGSSRIFPKQTTDAASAMTRRRNAKPHRTEADAAARFPRYEAESRWPWRLPAGRRIGWPLGSQAPGSGTSRGSIHLRGGGQAAGGQSNLQQWSSGLWYLLTVFPKRCPATKQSWHKNASRNSQPTQELSSPHTLLPPRNAVGNRGRGSIRSLAGSIPRCTARGCGQCGCTPGSALPRNRTSVTATFFRKG